MGNTILFKEVQRFTQWWIWIPLFSILIYMYYRFLNSSQIDNIALPLIIFLAILLAIWRLKTEIDADEIRMHVFPFFKKRVKWSEIRSVEVVDYGFQGGWGIRHSDRYGWIYNIRGKMGLALTLTNGKKFLIGTQSEIELAELIMRLRSKN